jgi:ribonucleoside-diphosphate reductase alpha chain
MIKIQKIKVKARPVYDITVDGNHNFFANGINVSSCNEITLHSSKDYTYSCVLSSLNLIHWDKIKNSDIVRVAIVFLDCVNQEFIERAKNIRGLEKVVAFARKSRALGLGVCGLHSLFQQKMIAFDSLEAHMLNIEIFKYIREEAEAATAEIAKTWGEPEWCKGYGRANSHLLAVAPTKSG